MVMSAYNKVNGEACAMNHRLLCDILREEWGFRGFVVSDWGGAYDRIAALNAGNDLAMPGPLDPREIVGAVEEGSLGEATLDERVSSVLRVVLKLPAFAGRPASAPPPPLDRERSAPWTSRCRPFVAHGQHTLCLRWPQSGLTVCHF